MKALEVDPYISNYNPNKITVIQIRCENCDKLFEIAKDTFELLDKRGAIPSRCPDCLLK